MTHNVEEIWKDVEGYEGLYKISENGNVLSLRGKFKPVDRYVKTYTNNLGYSITYLSRLGKVKTAKVHRLVAIAFVPNPENKPQVNHKDGNKLNNHWTNLEWCTSKENILHAHKEKLTTHKRGFENPTTKLTKSQRDEIARLYAVGGVGQKGLANRFNVSQALISLAIKDYIRLIIENGYAIDRTTLPSLSNQ